MQVTQPTTKELNMKELQDLVNKQVENLIETGAIEKMVQEGVQNAIQQAISRQFDAYGSITKELEKVIKSKLTIDESQLNIPSFNALMERVVNSAINEFHAGEAGSQLKELMQKKLSPLPSEMTIVAFIDTIVEFWRGDDYEADKYETYASVEFEHSKYGWYDLKIWNGPKETGIYSTRPTTPEIKLSIRENGQIMGRHGVEPYYMNDVDGFILKAYAQGVKITELEESNPSCECDLSLWHDN